MEQTVRRAFLFGKKIFLIFLKSDVYLSPFCHLSVGILKTEIRQGVFLYEKGKKQKCNYCSYRRVIFGGAQRSVYDRERAALSVTQ
ncbi:MAG: hypothetical protein IK037_04610 [Clostridia bacterium]|nr:hypothetical protein [Clostridia bacterium]